MMIVASAKPDGMFAQAWWIFQDNIPLFWYGIKITLLLAVCGTLIGLLIGLLLGGIRAVRIEERDAPVSRIIKKILHGFVGLYVWIFRGTPMMVQALIIYHGLRPVLNWSPVTAGITIISINTGAYMAEIIRAGIQSIDKEQNEAARSLGMTSTQTMMSIILPQAIRNSFPSIGNEFIVNIKDSSMLNVIGVIELYFQSSSVAGSLMLYVPTFIVAAILYLMLTTLATQLLSFVEGRMNMPRSSGPSSQSVPVERVSEVYE